MAGDTGGNGIYYWSNNGIDTNKTMLGETTAPGFGRGSYQISFTRPSGKSFIKWNTAADGSGTDYFPGDNVEQLLGSGTDLYAIWGDIPLIVQKSSIEDIADTVRSKKTAWLSADIGLTELNTKIDSMVPLDAVPNDIRYSFPQSVWLGGTVLSVDTQNMLNINGYENKPLIVVLSLSTYSSPPSPDYMYYLILHKYRGTTWLAQPRGRQTGRADNNLQFTLGETTTASGKRVITIQGNNTSTLYIINTMFLYLYTA